MNIHRPKSDSKRRLGVFLLAAAAHGGVLALAVVLGRPAMEKAKDVVTIIWQRPPSGGDGHVAGKGALAPKKRKIAKAAPVTSHDLQQPQTLATPEPVATQVADATDAADAANDGKDSLSGAPGEGCPTCPDGPGNGRGLGNDPNLPPGDQPGGNGPVDIRALHIEPVAISARPPTYPAIALSSGLTGSVTLEIIVDENGVVQSARVVGSQPPFDAAALSSVRTWRYLPVLVHGQAIPWRGQVTVRFQLR